MTRSASGSSRASSGWSCSRCTRSTYDSGPHVPEFQVEGHARGASADDTRTGQPWYTPGPELDSFRLSSKSHWDVPIEIGNKTVHFLVSHPTPPVFDGPEDRNGTRNHDEIRFWADYVGPGAATAVATSTTTTATTAGSSRARCSSSPATRTPTHSTVTASPGGPAAPARQPARQHQGHAVEPRWARAGGAAGWRRTRRISATRRSTPPTSPTSSPGNLRADYVLPSKNLRITDAGVFWPGTDRSVVPPRRNVPVPQLGSSARVGRRESRGVQVADGTCEIAGGDAGGSVWMGA